MASKAQKRAKVAKKPAASKSRRRQDNVTEISPGALDSMIPDREQRRLPTRLEARTEAQHHYIELIKQKSLVFGVGPWGTGKTYVATAKAALDFRDKKINKIIVTRPLVATEEMGFLPGTEQEKCAPYFKPVYEILEEWLGESLLEWAIKRKKIEFVPLAFMRGNTFNNTFVLMDEAQNSTPKQMKLLISRIGENSTLVIDGDTDQKDIKGPSGLADALETLGHLDNWVGVLEFSEDDIVRSEFSKAVFKAYKAAELRREGDQVKTSR